MSTLCVSCSPKIHATSKAVLMNWRYTLPVGVSLRCQLSFLLSSCHSQRLCRSCVIVTWKCQHPIASTPPTRNCTPAFRFFPVARRDDTSRVPLRHHRRERKRPVTSDLLSWCCVGLPQEYLVLQFSKSWELLLTHEAGLETRRALVNLLEGAPPSSPRRLSLPVH